MPKLEFAPRHYSCLRAVRPPVIDGRLDDEVWAAAQFTERFIDIEGFGQLPPRLGTRAKMLWDDEFLYVGAVLEDPHVWGTLTARDSVIFYDNDFEIFIDPDGDTHEYYELEINALGTEWDLLIPYPYRDGGHGVNAWDIAGLKTAIFVAGTVNDPSDVDDGWMVEIAIPFKVLAECARRPCPPEPGDTWRVNFSRVQWRTEVVDGGYRKKKDPKTGDPLPEDNWVWSPQGLVNMHYPEMWGFVTFVESEPTTFTHGPRERMAWALRLIYYREQNHHAVHGRYTNDLRALGLNQAPLEGVTWPPKLHATPHLFQATGRLPDGTEMRIRQDSRIRLLEEAE